MVFSCLRAHTGPVAAALAVWFGATPGDALADTAKPNIILIMSDDEDVAAHAFMPKTKALIEDEGTTFANFFISYPICCPSRASILRGQYAHNTQVLDNKPPLGGYEKFDERDLEASTLGTWLQAAGYRTAMIGKYINRYTPEKDGVPPGWNDWYVGGNAHPSYDYTLNENGRVVHYGDDPEDYLTDVLARKAVQVIRAAADDELPFFLYVQPYTPHSPSIAAPRHLDMFSAAVLPRSPPSTRPTWPTSRLRSAVCRRSTRSAWRRWRRSTASGSRPCRRSTTWSRASSTRWYRCGCSTTPT